MFGVSDSSIFFPVFGAGVFWWSLEEQNWRRWCFEEVLSCQRRREIFQDALFWNRLLRVGGFTCLCARRVRCACLGPLVFVGRTDVVTTVQAERERGVQWR